jgi:hypothetical protein
MIAQAPPVWMSSIRTPRSLPVILFPARDFNAQTAGIGTWVAHGSPEEVVRAIPAVTADSCQLDMQILLSGAFFKARQNPTCCHWDCPLQNFVPLRQSRSWSRRDAAWCSRFRVSIREANTWQNDLSKCFFSIATFREVEMQRFPTSSTRPLMISVVTGVM